MRRSPSNSWLDLSLQTALAAIPDKVRGVCYLADHLFRLDFVFCNSCSLRLCTASVLTEVPLRNAKLFPAYVRYVRKERLTSVKSKCSPAGLQQGIVFVLCLGEARLDALTLLALAGCQGLASLQLTLGLGLEGH